MSHCSPFAAASGLPRPDYLRPTSGAPGGSGLAFSSRNNITKADVGHLVAVWAFFVPCYHAPRQVIMYMLRGVLLQINRNSRHHCHLLFQRDKYELGNYRKTRKRTHCHARIGKMHKTGGILVSALRNIYSKGILAYRSSSLGCRTVISVNHPFNGSKNIRNSLSCYILDAGWRGSNHDRESECNGENYTTRGMNVFCKGSGVSMTKGYCERASPIVDHTLRQHRLQDWTLEVASQGSGLVNLKGGESHHDRIVQERQPCRRRCYFRPKGRNAQVSKLD